MNAMLVNIEVYIQIPLILLIFTVPTFSFGKPAETTKVENKPASGKTKLTNKKFITCYKKFFHIRFITFILQTYSKYIFKSCKHVLFIC